jgi:arsenate reductase
MAEGLLRHYGNSKFEVYSAGFMPSFVHPLAIKAMAELGIDITGQRSKSANEYLDQEFSYVITVCDNAKILCPTFPGQHRRLHWSIEDPISATGSEEEMLKAFRKVCHKILKKINHFISTYENSK